MCDLQSHYDYYSAVQRCFFVVCVCVHMHACVCTCMCVCVLFLTLVGLFYVGRGRGWNFSVSYFWVFEHFVLQRAFCLSEGYLVTGTIYILNSEPAGLFSFLGGEGLIWWKYCPTRWWFFSCSLRPQSRTWRQWPSVCLSYRDVHVSRWHLASHSKGK